MNQNRKNLSNFSAVLAILLLGLWVAKLIFNTETEDPALYVNSKNARESIVHIEVGDSIKKWYGTGFFVAPDKIATNIHVVALPGPIFAKQIIKDRNSREVLGFKFTKINNIEMIWNVVGVTAFDVKNDLVILKVNTVSLPFLLGNSNSVKINEPITTMGFPNRKYKVTKGPVYSIRKSDQWLRISISLQGGCSGSPVLNRKGEVMGILAYLNPDHKYSLAIPSNALNVLLAKSDKTEPLAKWHQRDEIRSYAYHLEGKNKFDRGRYIQAITELDNAIQLNNKSVYSYYKRGIAKLKQGEREAKMEKHHEASNYFNAAIEDFTQAIKINPKNAGAYTQRAKAKFELGDHNAALSDYEKSIEINPQHIQVYYQHGLIKSNLGDNEFERGNAEKALPLYEDAIYYYTIAIERTHKFAKAHRKLKETRNSLSKCTDDHIIAMTTRKHYKTLIKNSTKEIKTPSKPLASYNGRGYTYYMYAKFESEQGNIAKAQKLFEDALEDYTHVINRNPVNLHNGSVLAYAYNGRGITKIELGHIETDRGIRIKASELYESAIQDFDGSIKIIGTNARYYYNRGRAKEALGHNEEAKADFDKAKEIYPNVEQ